MYILFGYMDPYGKTKAVEVAMRPLAVWDSVTLLEAEAEMAAVAVQRNAKAMKKLKKGLQHLNVLSLICAGPAQMPRPCL